MIHIIFSSFLLVAASEMGDKTQLLAFLLAARFKKPWPMMAGILVATLLNHGIASALGHWIGEHIRADFLSYALALTFIGFGFWTLKPDSIKPPSNTAKHGVFLTTAFLFFFAEMGDKTQLATAALAARFNSIFAVTFGTTLGMLVSDGIAVFFGEKITAKVQMKWIRYTAATLFFAFGIFSLLQAHSL